MALHRRIRRTAVRRRRVSRTEEEKKSLKRKAIVLPVVLALIGILTAVMYVMVDKRDIFSIDQFLNPKLYNTVEINGVQCRRRTRIKSYLFMGVDASGKVGEENSRDAGTGQSDVLQLIVIDQNANTYTVLPISRDTIAAVRSLDEEGNVLAETDIQISYAHAKGDGKEISCENAVYAVSKYLYGQPIDGYLSLNMDSISVINHQLGGVPVTIEDDFSQFDPSMKIGETIKLTDEQAVYFVRYRRYVGDSTNESRMRRQDQYLANAQPIFMEKLYDDENFMLDFYDALSDYMVTSLTGKDISKLAKAMRSNEYLEPPQIEGEIGHDDFGFKQFFPDAESVGEAVLELFYEKV